MESPGLQLSSPTAVPHHYMRTPSPTGGLFDITGAKHEPPDFLDIDSELLTTLYSPRTSVDSLENSTDALIMDNWQMNEVFQDISDILKESDTTTIEHTEAQLPKTGDSDLDELVKNILSPNGSVNVDDDAAVASEQTMDTAATTVDLSWIISETLGTDVLDITAASPEVPSHRVSTDSFDLLDQLENMSDEQSANSDNTSVEKDHQYTQLADVKVKPHETKKQAIRRVKNNAASRVCRKQRKNRLTVNMSKVDELTLRNSELRKNISDVEEMVALLKEHLVKVTKK